MSYQMKKRPYVLAGVSLGLGYVWALLRRTKRPVSPELVRFHRTEQMLKLTAIIRSLVRSGRVDSFSVVLSGRRDP